MPRAASPTSSKSLLLARVLVALTGLASLAIQFDAKPIGDEVMYFKSARDLAGLLLGHTSGEEAATAATAEVFDGLRGRGWFLPGISFALVPVEILFDGKAPILAHRIWMLLLNLGLLFAIVERLGRRLGGAAALLFAVACALSPYFVAHLSSLFGGALAILATILLFLWIDSWRLEDLTPTNAALIGALAAVIVYLRAMYLPIVFILMAAFTLLAAERAEWRRLPRALLSMLLGAAALLAPWSWWVSQKFGPTLTTTTMMWSQIAAFGERSIREELRQEGEHRNLSYAFHQAIAARAESNGVTFQEQARSERARALGAATLPELLDDTAENIDRYVSSPHGFLERFGKARCRGRAGCLPKPVASVLYAQAAWSWYLCAAFLSLYMLVPFSFDGTSRWLPFFGKSLVFMILLHCFVAYAHDRYYFQLFPVAGVVAAWATSIRRRSRDEPTPAPRLHGRLIALGQVASAAFILLFLGLYWRS